MRTQEENRKKAENTGVLGGGGREYADGMRVFHSLKRRDVAAAGSQAASGRVVCSQFPVNEGAMPMSGTSNWNELEQLIGAAVKLGRRPVTVAFLESAPANVEKFSGTEPSSCSFWRLAASGRVFYTVPENHFNCAVGAYTHNISLSPERQGETEQTLKMMFDLGYVKPEEVPQIPRLPKAPGAILYAPLGESPVAPDVVLFACKPAGAMLLNEAANRAGVASRAPALGRPTCMALPASLQHGSILSLGCIGNRVYTGLAEDEMYLVLRGKDLVAVADVLAVITSANAALHDYARGRREQLATS
jgi:uncharacterized protein (DUF169 family)